MKIMPTSLLCTMLIVALLAPPAQANHVMCSCPNVNAKVTGSTSCSASESSGQCTIAFNEFDQNLEITAKSLLESYSQEGNIQFGRFPAFVGSAKQRGFTQRNAIWLSQQTRNSIVDQIMIYALVTLVQSGEFKNKRDKISAVHQSLRTNAVEISRVFTSGGVPYKDEWVQVNHGCFAFNAGNVWGMYKTNWSPSIDKERC